MLAIYLGIIFIALKLVGVIAWSFLSPFILVAIYSFVISAIVTANGLSQGKTQQEIMEDFMRMTKMGK